MANHKSALKRNRQSLVRRERNRANRTRVKTAIKRIDAAMEVENSAEQAQEALNAAIPIIDRAVVKGAFHKKTGSRKVSRLTQRVNGFIKSKESAA